MSDPTPMYDLYKPLRNALRKQGLLPSLQVIWAWMQHLQFSEPLPDWLTVPQQVRFSPPGPHKGIYEWELALLARELIAEAPLRAPLDSGCTLYTWREFSKVVNKLKDLDNAISASYPELFRDRIILEMSRIAHHQFRWQHGMREDVTRYFKIFSHPGMDDILQAHVGISARGLLTIGLSTAGHYLGQFDLPTPVGHQLGGVSPEQVAWFFGAYARDLDDMRKRCAEARQFNETFIYSFNPLVQFPLLSCVLGNETHIVCPVPRYLIQRFTEGVYYDVVNAAGFDAAFGSAYQTYVGEVFQAANTRGSLVVLPEAEYRVGKDLKRSVDWIASDTTGELFVECKTKRLRVEAKVALGDLTVLKEELEKLAEFAVQIYRTLSDALKGNYPHWTPSERPIFPIVVTLEDWYVFGHEIAGEIDVHLRSAFREKGLDEAMLERYPLRICSVAEFEDLVSIIASKNVRSVMREVGTRERRLWLLHAALNDAFRDDHKKLSCTELFPGALDTIIGT